MKKLLTALMLSLSSISNSQTPIYYDYIENFTWFGDWWLYNSSGFYTNISVSPTVSAALIGFGTSTYEYDWYVLPNVPLDPTKPHLFKFRLAAQRLSNPAAASGGMDTGDYVEVQVSTDGGFSYLAEMRIRGFNNATWNYNTNGVISETLDGVNQVYTPTAGGDRTNTGDGWSDISLVIPQGNTNLAVDLYVRANANGEDWWIDNIELFELSGLPVELIMFNGITVDNLNIIRWETSSEHNSSHFLLKRSSNGVFDESTPISITEASGNSQEKIQYSFVDKSFPNQINYYQLVQVDMDGNSKTYGPISIDNRVKKNLVKITNMLGQDIDESYRGVVIEVYDDGSIIKTLR